LQDNPTHDLVEFRKRQRQGLEEYRWIDKKEGIVELPIERAMELIAARGLPTAKQPAPEKASPEKASQSEQTPELRQP
jgi:hypothetical protein